ncbi:hypothetical protein H4R33_006389 [Dimargaris cristalligena]|uniref:Yeast cell wall synthesis Kre9/Knh1-like N-terminal domain-containing protein n=1 Tax=Dimargaris cristalligena TaxID=215637 RepID=A0A4Q0A199_9FUNG|nr:hypothetical protein H4R33_006389 [Dimargaris cristalligena]RKP39538.1 hypothetical protein BJ085DRAFT_30957 [Dimargaris cristalligena]|eukprot:RKP39538.1 hypothetical protein BJ085DRAFT_30957 [Dimargaris cristalligena]
MKSYTLSTFALAIAALTQAGQAYFYTTNLAYGEAWTPGQSTTIVWEAKPVTGESAPGKTYTALLKTGGDTDQQTIATIAANVPIDQTTLTFTPPANLPKGMYFVQFVSGDLNNWSTRASVDGGDSWTPLGTGAEAQKKADALASGSEVRQSEQTVSSEKSSDVPTGASSASAVESATEAETESAAPSQTQTADESDSASSQATSSDEESPSKTGSATATSSKATATTSARSTASSSPKASSTRTTQTAASSDPSAITDSGAAQASLSLASFAGALGASYIFGRLL